MCLLRPLAKHGDLLNRTAVTSSSPKAEKACTKHLQPRPSMSFARLLPPLLLLVVLVVFALQNTAVLTVNFLIWSFQLSQALHIVLCGASGLGCWCGRSA